MHLTVHVIFFEAIGVGFSAFNTANGFYTKATKGFLTPCQANATAKSKPQAK